MRPDDPVLEVLLAKCRRDHNAWINGDASPFALPDDGSIMGAVGGTSLGGAVTKERQLNVARQWQSGEGDIEFVNGGVNGEFAWVAFLEHATVTFVGDDEPRPWNLRVTEIFRRSNDGTWERVHRPCRPACHEA